MTADLHHADWLAAAAARARAASALLARTPDAARNAGLHGAAAAIRAAAAGILAANEADLAASQASPAFRDRLTLTPPRVEAMAQGLADIAALPDPLARTLADWTRPNGLRIRRIAAPIGVIGMIYESRPNVGADAAGLCLKAGNAVILRGGSESLHSARAIHAAIAGALVTAGLPDAAVQIAPDGDRAHVAAMLAAPGSIDLIIPRGGRSLVERVQREARVPVLAHAEGMNHVYVHHAADPAMARAIVANAKMRRTGVCGATETLLLDRQAAAMLPGIVAELAALGCRFRADPAACAILPALPPADAADFDTEWLDAVLNIAIVDGVDGALTHIASHGSEHTDAIVTEDEAAAARFLAGVSSAVALWNASTQFCDGGEFGFGAEIGIATGRIHARGPVGVEQLTSFRYVVTGQGQVRPLTAPDPVPRYGHRHHLRVGLLGGSFNPAHAGHRHVAEVARRRLRLDQVWLLVSPGNPLKRPDGMAPLADRLATARAIADGRRTLATAIERELGTRYTADTLLALHQLFPRVDFVWLMGSDILAELPAWRHWLRVAGTVPLAVLPRPGYNHRALAGQAARRLRGAMQPARAAVCLAGSPAPAWTFLPAAQNAISATALRAAYSDPHRPNPGAGR